MEITSFVLGGDEIGMPSDISDISDAGTLAEVLSAASGHFAFHTRVGDGCHLLTRDPLGVNKLFFAIDDDGEVHSSNYLVHLARVGHRLSDIWSVPSGHVLAIDTSRRSLSLQKFSTIRFGDDMQEALSIDDYAAEIRSQLDQTFERLREVVGQRPVYVTLSGGLDSSTIAAMAAQWLDDVRAVTFCMDSGSGDSPASEDLTHARLVADFIGVPLEVVTATTDEIEDLLDVALIYGQDWRDFNVHCALVNATIGRAIGDPNGSNGNARTVVLTGDTMNELMADYSPVQYRGNEYYRLPRLDPGRLRRFLVSGLDSGDREVGVFAHYGLDTIQPYAIFANAYTSLPAEYVQNSDAKQRLVEKVMGERIPAEIYSRPKVRAQVGGSEEIGGTLAALVDRGLNGERLQERFVELLGCETSELRRLIHAGFYRFPTQYPERSTQ